ncbi:STY4528 family pathogenicity island replication protein [Verticiella sediminum]|uniref:STY4528 family pathogenicity island replication protein n=1 Tax=Verticiella sediminum TaxID=1247510 RepID=UPI001FE54F79|nr:STY4528 family pathogenicity island replication protein [Verticiella sediminum]
MADHHTRHNPLGQDALFSTPASLMLDARLTPLERNGWQVLRMLRSAEGISPLANLGQLRRYLTSTPLGQRAGYETARRVLVVLRLTGWISLGGQQRDPLTGHVLSELYQVHESALDFQQAHARCQPARASAIFYRPRKQPGGSGCRPHSDSAGAGT